MHDAYVTGFCNTCQHSGIDPELLIKLSSRTITMKRLQQALVRVFSNKSGRIAQPTRTLTKLENMGIPAKSMLANPGKGIISSEKSTRKYLSDIARGKLK